ncbi:MAG: PocR ligand-binding domain-containing protein [Candidatus Hydrogenedentes bacterium]|nr:PocR ligand-binding domain-containing protein [Candidatus Hydrogenedentota bacterium]
MGEAEQSARETRPAWMRGNRPLADAVPAEALAKVRGQVEPAFAFAVSYLHLLSEELGLGALAVWFGAEGIREDVAGGSREFEWQDELAALLRTTKPLGPQGQSAFCTALRRHPEGNRRCHECDAKWIARARKSGRSWTYQCHAGLSEVIAPIVVNGKRIGEIMGGQVLSTDDLPGGFDEVWRRVRDIEGLHRAVLAEAFDKVRVVDKASLRIIRVHLQAAARALGALIESVAGLMSREALLGQVRSYLERDFAWYALTRPDANKAEVDARSRALGLSETPSVAIVVQADRTSRATFGHRRSRATSLPALFEAAQRLLHDAPNTIVCSIRPEELVVLLSPERTRNPSLRRLRVQELAATIERELEAQCAGALLVGVSECEAPFRSLATAYEEAQADIGRKALSSMADEAALRASMEKVASRMTELGHTVRRAVRDAARPDFDRAVEAQLRLVAGCPEDTGPERQCLFTQMVLNLLSALRAASEDARAVDGVQTRYALIMPALGTTSDMLGWFHGNVMPLAEAVLLEPGSRLDGIVAKACDLAAARLSESTGRDEIAEELGVSATHFGRVFREKAGMTFREFLKRLRVWRAQQLLLHPGRTVAEVAAEVGYSTTAAFSRRFEQVCGASPCAYRNNPQAFPRINLPALFEE